jgi:hypothetical protein
MTASFTDVSNHLAAKPVLSGTRDALGFAVYDGSNAPAVLAGQYAQLAYSTLGAFPAMLRQFDFGRILTGRNLLVFVQQDGELLSGAYASRDVRGERAVLAHKGYVSIQKVRGLAKVMIAALHLADEREAGAPADGEAVARVLPATGEINQASSSPFADMGFHGVRNFWSRIARNDIHLAPFAEIRPDGLWIGSHLMAGRGEKIAARAREALAEWTISRGEEGGPSLAVLLSA